MQQRKKHYIWIDQICINQKDDDEKSHQIQHIQHIYTDAERVIVWLGPAAHDSDLLIAHLQKIAHAWSRCDFKIISRLLENEKHVNAISKAYEHFCRRRYWSRLWVMQEFAVGSQTSIICGGSSISAQVAEIALTAGQYLEKNFKRRGSKKNDELAAKTESVYRNPSRSFVENLFTRRLHYRDRATSAPDNVFFKVMTVSLVLEGDCNWPETSDDRDRVFALLNLAHDASEFTQFPDYSWTCERVYTELALKLLQQGHIDILSYCQSWPDHEAELPSWAPDWSMKLRSPCAHVPWLTNFAALGTTGPGQKVARLGHHEIMIRGTIVDTVKDISSDIWDPDWSKHTLDRRKTKAYLDTIRQFCKRSPRIRIDEEDMDAARIAMVDSPDWDPMSGTDRANLRAWLEEVTKLLDDESIDDIPAELTFFKLEEQERSDIAWYSQLRRIHSRRIFISTTGYVGLCPWHTEIGDKLCIFLGGNTPYIIRPTGQGNHTLIGEAYAHGIMYGEIMKDDQLEIDNIVLE
jgi:hypothetical protein